MTDRTNPPAFDWSSVEWTTYSGHPATGTRLQTAQIGPNTYWRLATHDYDTNTDTPLGAPPYYTHERDADRAYRWIITAEERHEALDALAAQIQPGWTVDITDHDYLPNSWDGALVESVTDDGLIICSRRPVTSRGRSSPTLRVTWDDDWEVSAPAYTVNRYRVPTSVSSRSTPGVPRLVKTFRFRPPRNY